MDFQVSFDQQEGVIFVKFPIFLAAFLLMSLSACSHTEVVASNNDSAEEKVYITGSNLAQRRFKSKVGTMSKEEVEAARDAALNSAVTSGAKN